MKLREKRKETVQDNTAINLGGRSAGLTTSLSKSPSAFLNRILRKRAWKKTKESLPEMPQKKAELLEEIASSQRSCHALVAKGLVQTPDEEKEVSALKAMAADILEGMEHMKRSGSKDNRAAYIAFYSVGFGEKSKAKKISLKAS